MLKGRKKGKATTAKIALWYTFSNVFVKGLVFLTTPIFTRLLTKTEFGLFSNFTSWESILVVLLTLDFTQSIMRAKYDYEERMDDYISSILLVSNIVTLGTYIIVEINSGFFEKVFSMDIMYIRGMFLYILFLPAFNYLQTKHRIYRKYQFFVAFAISSALLSTGVSVALVIFMKDKLLGRMIGFVLPPTLMNIALEVFILSKSRKIDWDCVKYAARICIPLIPHALSGIILGNSDRIMITQYVGAEATAVYTLAYQVSLLANLLWLSMNQAWAPWLYDNIHSGNKELIRKNSKIYLGVFSVLVIGVLLVTPELMLIMGGRQYFEARFVMPPVIMGCVFSFIYGMYVNLEIYSKKTFTISVGTTGAAALNIGLNMLFIPRYGYIAAAYTTLVGYGALFLFHYLIVRFKIKPLKDVYENKFIFSIIAIMMFCCAATLLLYSRTTLRLIILAVYIVIMAYYAIKHKDVILRLFGIRKKQ